MESRLKTWADSTRPGSGAEIKNEICLISLDIL